MRVLIIVDVQRDFLPGGPMGVAGGDEVVPVLRDLAREVDAVVATRDWHPRDHVSFADNHPGHEAGDVIDAGGLRQILWPVHCVQDTPGAAFAEGLDLPPDAIVVDKGTDVDVDSYSGFFDNGRRHGTGLAERLAELSPDEVLVGGLATDYCVQATVLDACELGHRVTVVTDACRAVNLRPGDDRAAVDRMTAAGAWTATSAQVRAGTPRE